MTIPVVPALPHRWKNWLAVSVLIALTSLACVAAWPVFFAADSSGSETRTNSISDLTRLPQDSAVDVSGVVTFVNPETHEFYLQDGTGAFALAIPSGTIAPTVADRVTIHARLENDADPVGGLRAVELKDVVVERLGHGSLPSPQQATLEDFISASNVNENRLIETTAVVRAARREGPRLILELNGTQGVPVYVVEAGSLDTQSLLDAQIRIQGVLSYQLTTEVRRTIEYLRLKVA